MERVSRHHAPQQGLNKVQRKNKAKQQRLQQTADKNQERKIFAGPSGAPRVISLVPLCKSCSPQIVIDKINESMGFSEKSTPGCMIRTFVDNFKTNLGFIAGNRNLIQALDISRGADFVIFVIHPDEPLDELAETILRTIGGQGVSNTFTIIQDGNEKDTPITQQSREIIGRFFPEQAKPYSVSSLSDCQNLTRSLCTTIPKGIKWREERNWLYVENLEPTGETFQEGDATVSEAILTGHVRGSGNLSTDRLIHLGNWGTFQISRIVGTKRRRNSHSKEISFMPKDWEETDLLSEPTSDQDTLDQLAPQEIIMDDLDDEAASIAPTAMTQATGVLLDDHRYVEESLFPNGENVNFTSKPKRIPRGTSNYQSAWYVEDLSDSGSDLSDIEPDMDEPHETGPSEPFDPADGMDVDIRPPTEAGPSDYAHTDLISDEEELDDDEEGLEGHRKRKKAAEADLMFPDEIELHPEVFARERLAKYRGLRSLKNSVWSTDEDKPYEPEDWKRLLEVSNYKAAYGRVKSEGISSSNSVKPGTRVTIYLRAVPLHLLQSRGNSNPLFAYALHRHEHKNTVVNFSFSLAASLDQPLKSKDELFMLCGPRLVSINPLFSASGTTPNDVHKFLRFVHPGQNAVASFIGPITWGSVPALFFRRRDPLKETDLTSVDQGDTMEYDVQNGGGNKQPSHAPTPSLELIGQGTAQPPSISRVIAKRVVLTGQPFKVHRRVVTVRYMFFNTEDVAYFSALPLWTNRGRSGVIKESLGTHGYYKATFDTQIGMQDAIGVSLYKRVWPRPAKAITEEDKDALPHDFNE